MRLCAFYRSGFESATAVIVDGAGTFIPMNINAGMFNEEFMTWECESIFHVITQMILRHFTSTKAVTVPIRQTCRPKLKAILKVKKDS